MNLEAMSSGGASALVFHAAAGTVLGLLMITTVMGRDLWPFSHYPMFAGHTEANAVRFFRLFFLLPSGETVSFSGVTAFLADDAHREFERRWSAVTGQRFDAGELALRYWQEACRFDPALAAATGIELRMHVARVVAGGKIVVAEKSLQTVATSLGA